MANLDIVRGRQVVIPLQNRSGGDVIAGDVVVLDTATASSFITTTTARETKTVGIVQEPIAALGTGRVLISGYAPLVNVGSAVTLSHYLETSTIAKQATGTATRRSGCFGQFSSAGTTPAAILWGIPDGTTVSPVLTSDLDDLVDVNAPTPANGDVLTWDSTPGEWVSAAPAAASGNRAIEFVIDGGGSAITTGIKGDVEVPFACTITAWRVFADAAGAIAVAIWKDTYANFPPVVGDLLVTPTITATNAKAEATGLSHALAAGDILRFNVNSITTITRATVSLTVS